MKDLFRAITGYGWKGGVASSGPGWGAFGKSVASRGVPAALATFAPQMVIRQLSNFGSRVDDKNRMLQVLKAMQKATAEGKDANHYLKGLTESAGMSQSQIQGVIKEINALNKHTRGRDYLEDLSRHL